MRAAGRPVPAFRVEARLGGITTRSWITDVGDVVREESPMGLLVVRETPEQARTLAVPGAIQTDLLEAAALVPRTPRRIDDPTTVARLVVRIDSLSGFDPADLQGAGQTASGDTVEVRDPRDILPGPAPADLAVDLRPELFLESDAPEIREEAEKAVGGASSPRERAERLVRHVHAIIEKKPTMSLPSALEVLKTRIGDCNEHTALYVAMARSLDLPARVAVGLVYLRGAFYYHAWPEVWVDEARGLGRWLPVDPTLNQFPADATHVRLARGGLDRQAAILGLVGRARLEITDLELRPGATPILVGRAPSDLRPLDLPLPRRDGSGRGCWSSPDEEPRMIVVRDLAKTFGSFKAVDGVSLEVPPGEIHGFLGPNGAGKTTTIRMIAGLLKPTAGSVSIDGRDLGARARGGEGRPRLHSRPALPLREAHRLGVPALPRRPLRGSRARPSRPARPSSWSSSSSSPGGTSSWRASPTA